jgi:phospholipid/cholesterol/gamma-HCH transport system substrate-binding protein
VKRAVVTHWADFAATAVLVVAAIAVSGYILLHQPAFQFGQSYYTVNAQFSTAAAVTSGQGQAVAIAGVQVGQVGGVHLQDGQAMVTMNIDPQYAPIYRNATVLLRPRTPLKDMYLELDPGSRSAGRVPNGGTIGLANTTPDVDLSEILSSLDADTRNYLILLLSGGAQIFQDHSGQAGAAPTPAAVAALRSTLKRFAPLDHHTRTLTELLALRQTNIRRAIHNFRLVIGALGGVENRFASLISSSDTNFSAIASQDAQLRTTLARFPATLRQSTVTFNGVRQFAAASAITLSRLQPFARNLGPALHAVRPLFRDTTPVLAHQLRPFAVAVQPVARTLAPASLRLARTIPALSRTVSVLNALFNTLAYRRGGQPSYLFWGAWLAHITQSLTAAQDADGAVIQGLFDGTCGELDFFEGQLQPNNQPLGVILDLLNAPKLSQLPGVTPIAGTTQFNCPSTP